MVIKVFKVGIDMWRAETAFDQGRFPEAFERYAAAAAELKRRNKRSFDIDLKAAMAAHNIPNQDCAREAYLRAHQGICAASKLGSDNRNYLLSYIEHWCAELGEERLAMTDRVFNKAKVRKRWLSEFPINW